MRFVLFVVGCSLILSSAQAICEWEPDGSFLPDPTSRSRFYWCWGGSAISGTCEVGKEFDPFERICERPHGVPNNPCFNRPDNTFLVDPSSRQRFIWCWNGEAIPGFCDAGKEFHPVDLVCERTGQPPVPTSTVMPTRAPRDPCFNQPDNTFLADPSSRSRFLWCFGGESIPGFCPAGEVFHEQGQYCGPEAATTIRTPPIPTTSRPINTTRAPPPQTTRGPPMPTTRTTTRGGAPPAPTRTTTRAGAPPAPTRTTARGGAPPMPTRQGRK